MSDCEAPRHSDLIPEDHAEAMRRFEAVRAIDPASLANLEKHDLLLAWWSFCWLEAALHPDDTEVWPEEVADALLLAAEARRRYDAREIEDGEYYPADAVRDRILKARAMVSQPKPEQYEQADTSET